MVTTHDDQLASAMKGLCLHGITRDAWSRYSDKGNWYYEVMSAGFKYNLSDLQSAIGLHQLRKLESFVAVRKRYADMLSDLMRDCDELELPPDRADSRHSWHLYMLRLNLDRLNINRDEFIIALRERGIGVSVHFIPIPLHPFFATFASREENQCPRALALYQRLISLPLYPAMTEQQVRYVAESVTGVTKNARKRLAVMTVGGK